MRITVASPADANPPAAQHLDLRDPDPAGHPQLGVDPRRAMDALELGADRADPPGAPLVRERRWEALAFPAMNSFVDSRAMIGWRSLRCSLRLLFLGAAAVFIAALGGCGSEEEDEPGATLTEQQVEVYEPGTPERATLEWWRAVQVSNAELASKYYAAGVRIQQGGDGSKVEQLKVEQLNAQLTIAAGAFQGEPEIQSVDETGNKATVFIELQPPDSEIPPQGRSVNLIKEGGGWKLADNFILIQAVARSYPPVAPAGPATSPAAPAPE